MTTEITTQPEHSTNVTTASMSARVVAEAEGRMTIAQRFPRDETRSYARVMQACSRRRFAEVAMYQYPRGNTMVRGPSIRMAEVLAQAWGNVDFGVLELERDETGCMMQAYAWDLETNTRRVQQFRVAFRRDKRGGSVALTDERDRYEITANMGARRLRACILAILPRDVVEEAVEQVAKTLTGGTDEPIADRTKRMVAKFSQRGVTAAHLESQLGRGLDTVDYEDLAGLGSIFNSLRDGATKREDWFDLSAERIEAAEAALSNDTSKPARKKTKRSKTKPSAEVAPSAEPDPEQAALEAEYAGVGGDPLPPMGGE